MDEPTNNEQADTLELESGAVKVGARNSVADQGRLQAAHDALVEAGAVCRPDDDDDDEMMSIDYEKTVITFGADVKALGDGKVGGYLCRYGSPKDTDLEVDYFTAGTDFGVTEGSNIPVYYQHGMYGTLKTRRIGRGVVKFDEVGMWIEAQLELRDEYERAVYELAQSGKLGWSSGAAGHLVEREAVGKAYHIKSWPIAEGSLTPTPAEPRNSAVPLKSLYVSEVEAGEIPVTDAAPTPVTETPIPQYQTVTETKTAVQPLTAKEIEMADNEEGKVVVPEIDYERLAAKVAEKLDTVGAAKSAPATIKAQNFGDPDPIKALTNWARGADPHSSLKALGAQIDPNGKELHFGYKAALQEDTATEGGTLVPNDFYAGIIAKRDEMSIPRRAGARVFRTSRDYLDIPYEDVSMTNFTKVAEEGAYNQNEPTFGNAQARIYKYTKVIKVSEELVEDEDANLDSFLTEAIGRSWALTENDLTLVGTGSSTVQGVFVGGSVGYTFADTNSITASEIPALFWSLGSPYHEGAVWVTRGATMGSLQGLTGNNFQLVGTPPFNGENRFWGGKEYFLSDSVAAIATGAKTMMIGNWNYYALVERRGLTMSRNPYLYQANGQIGLFCSVRMGGVVLQSEAFKWGIQT